MSNLGNSCNNIILTASGQLTSAQIKAIHGTPIQIIAAPGSGKIIQFVSAFVSFVYAGSNIFTAGASQTIAFYYGASQIQGTLITNAMLTSNVSKVAFAPGLATVSTIYTAYANQAINLYNPISTEITGNAAGDNVINWSVSYQILNV